MSLTQVKMRGYEGQLYYTPPSGTETIFANISDIDISVTSDKVDFSDHSAAGWKDISTGLKEWTGTVKALALQSGTDLTAFFTALTGGTTLTISFRPQDVTGGLAYTSSCVVMSYKHSAPNAGAQTLDLTLTGTAPLVLGTVTTGGQ